MESLTRELASLKSTNQLLKQELHQQKIFAQQSKLANQHQLQESERKVLYLEKLTSELRLQLRLEDPTQPSSSTAVEPRTDPSLYETMTRLQEQLQDELARNVSMEEDLKAMWKSLASSIDILLNISSTPTPRTATVTLATSRQSTPRLSPRPAISPKLAPESVASSTRSSGGKSPKFNYPSAKSSPVTTQSLVKSSSDQQTMTDSSSNYEEKEELLTARIQELEQNLQEAHDVYLQEMTMTSNEIATMTMRVQEFTQLHNQLSQSIVTKDTRIHELEDENHRLVEEKMREEVFYMVIPQDRANVDIHSIRVIVYNLLDSLILYQDEQTCEKVSLKYENLISFLEVLTLMCDENIEKFEQQAMKSEHDQLVYQQNKQEWLHQLETTKNEVETLKNRIHDVLSNAQQVILL
jgi:hypothetical protein